jgi:hypothetical protein
MTPRALALLAFVCFTAGCGTYGDKHVYGSYRLASAADLHAATLAVQKGPHPEKIYAYRVMGPDHIRMYVTESENENGSYLDARRVNGKWKDDGGTIVLIEPIGN